MVYKFLWNKRHFLYLYLKNKKKKKKKKKNKNERKGNEMKGKEDGR